MLKDCEGPVADSQVGKQANLLFFYFFYILFLFFNNYLVRLHCLVLTRSKSAGILLQTTNHCHQPSLTGNENVSHEVASKSKKFHSSREKGKDCERRWLQSHDLCRGIAGTCLCGSRVVPLMEK